MSTYIVGDIHGHHRKFLELLEKINFGKDDNLIQVGDICDRGSESIDTYRWFMEHRENAFVICGNHEKMMVDFFASEVPDAEKVKYLRQWLNNGGDPTLRALKALSEQELLDIMHFVMDLPAEIVVDVAPDDDLSKVTTYIIAHGWYYKDWVLQDIVWGRPSKDEVNPNKDILIVGHTPVFSLELGPFASPTDVTKYLKDLEEKGEHCKIYHSPDGRWMDIDCGSGYQILGAACKLAAIRLEDMQEFYV